MLVVLQRTRWADLSCLFSGSCTAKLLRKLDVLTFVFLSLPCEQKSRFKGVQHPALSVITRHAQHSDWIDPCRSWLIDLSVAFAVSGTC